jgi:hypothetical protein
MRGIWLDDFLGARRRKPYLASRKEKEEHLPEMLQQQEEPSQPEQMKVTPKYASFALPLCCMSRLRRVTTGHVISAL